MANTKSLFRTPIPFFWATGEIGSGKSSLGLNICPEETCLYDFEGSSISYVSEYPIKEYVLVHAELLKVKPQGFKPIDVYNWWVEDYRKRCTPGKFRVIMLDPISDIEDGLTSWVRNNPSYFGYTAIQQEKSSGIFWGNVKAHWKLILADLQARAMADGVPGCIFVTSHLSAVFGSDGKPTGKKQPKGKHTLDEMASLMLWLNRDVDITGRRPEVPRADVRKSRLARVSWEKDSQGEFVLDAEGNRVRIQQDLMPPTLPRATIGAIRKLLEKPIDLNNLPKEMLAVPEPEMSEAERLRLEVTLAETRLRQTVLDQESRQVVAKNQASVRTEAPGQPPEPAETAARPGSQPQQAPVPAAVPATSSPPEQVPVGTGNHALGKLTEAQKQKVIGLRTRLVALGQTDEQWKVILSKRGVRTALDLSQASAAELIESIQKDLAAMEEHAPAAVKSA